jgi:hypothetical protein
MPIVLTEPYVLDWLSKFDPPDQVIAGELLYEIETIDANNLIGGLRSSILAYAADSSGPFALYAERARRAEFHLIDW